MIVQDTIEGLTIMLLGMAIVFTFIGVMIGLMRLNQIIAERAAKKSGSENEAAVAAAAAYLKNKRQ